MGFAVNSPKYEVTVRQIEHVVTALRKNRMDAEFVESKEQLLEKLSQIVPSGATVASGGSMTLDELGVIDWLKNGDVNYLNADIHGGASEETMMKAHFCDYFFMSSNAITLEGELYNVDGNGNRVSALINGPKHVIIVAGANKIVADRLAAEQRVKTIAAPCNATRLHRNTGCSKTGYCVDCRTPERICCTTVISSYQRHPGRIKVFLLPDEYGY